MQFSENYDEMEDIELNLENIELEIKELELNREKVIKERLTDEKKKKIQKELENMKKEEVEHEVISTYEHISKLLYENLKSGSAYNYSFFEDLSFALIEIEYVIGVYRSLDIEIKDKIKKLISKCKYAIIFSKKYNIEPLSWEMKTSTLLLNNMVNESPKFKEEYENAKLICNENNELYKEYSVLYEDIFKTYIESEDYKERLKHLKVIKKKIDKNTKSISSN